MSYSIGIEVGSRLTSSESKRIPSTGLSSSSQSEANAIRLPASSADDNSSARVVWVEQVCGLTTPCNVNFPSTKPTTCSPRLRFPSRLIFSQISSTVGRSLHVQVRHSPTRAYGTHPVPSLLPVPVRQRYADEIIFCFASSSRPSLSCFGGGRFRCWSIESCRNQS